MPRKKRPPLPLVEQIRKISTAGISNSPKMNVNKNEATSLLPLDERIHQLLGLKEDNIKDLNKMLFFIMYDIENNKVRRLICKYLMRKGCLRIQKSIFIANQTIEVFNNIKSELEQVQSFYFNEDSIIVLPITSDSLKMMKIIGKNINMDIITQNKSTLFF